MALKALDIYKVLPKKNCKECGDPTCLTFAMKLSQGKADVEKCPYLDDEAKRVLGASTRPPIQKVRIGVGERSFLVGEEFVFYRHEKTFYHQPGILFDIPDTMPTSEIQAVVRRVKDERLVRIGQDLLFNGVAVRNVSGDPTVYGNAVATVEATGAHIPEVLIAGDPAAAEAGLAACGHFHPLLHAATPDNYHAMSVLAKKYGCPMAVRAEGHDELVTLVRDCIREGATRLLLDLTTPDPGKYLSSATRIRTEAINRTVPELGYPVYLDATVGPDQDSALILGITKYAGVIVTRPLSPSSAKAALTLRQNIFTDPQKPIQMNPGIYRVGNPGPDSPLFLTVNFSLTYFTLEGYLETTGMPCYLLLVDTEGLSVLTAVAAGKLNETPVRDSLAKFGVADLVSHKTVIIPGYASPLSGRIEDATGWKVIVGPRDAAEVGEFIEKEWMH